MKKITKKDILFKEAAYHDAQFNYHLGMCLRIKKQEHPLMKVIEKGLIGYHTLKQRYHLNKFFNTQKKLTRMI